MAIKKQKKTFKTTKTQYKNMFLHIYPVN